MKRYQLAVIACTANKNPLGRTAITLYRGGPFSLTVRHAQAQAEELLIMSAKYGLLAPEDPVEPYDCYLPNLDPLEREALVEHISRQARERRLVTTPGLVVSYLPQAYYSVLEEASPFFAARLDRPFKGLRMLTAWKLMSEELKGAAERKGFLDE